MRLFILAMTWGTLISLVGSSQAGDGIKTEKHTLAKEVDWKKVVLLVENIVKLDDGLHELSIRNSKVIVRTPAIQKIVDVGPDALPVLIAAMKIDELSFDTFTRCYSACNQILSKLKPGTRVFWQGGCETKRVSGSVTRIYPGGQIDQREFRRQVVEDVEKKYSQVLKGK